MNNVYSDVYINFFNIQSNGIGYLWVHSHSSRKNKTDKIIKTHNGEKIHKDR